MNLSKEMAVRLHRMMWSDMLKELGNNPSGEMRIKFKEDWIKRNFPEALVMHNCFLCEYSFHQEGRCCSNCPIKWPDEHCYGYNFSYVKAPISDILALPEKGLKAGNYATGYAANEAAAVERNEARSSGCLERSGVIFKSLSVYSGVSEDNWCVHDHVEAIKRNASEETKPLKQMNNRLAKQHIEVKDCLAKESGLDHDRPVGDHIREIVRNSMEAGAAEERDRIQEKIYEVLLS